MTTPLKPYLVRALYDWIVDNDLTPYLLVNAEAPEVVVPRQHVQNGRIVLNLRPQAIHDLNLGTDSIEFSARFGGTPMQLAIPVRAVLAIYAKETGKGMVFDEEGEDETPPPSEPSAPKSGKTRPTLRVVK